MTPKGVGIIGLKAAVQEHYSPGTWGLQHLKSLTASPYYDIVAVSNTTVESAQKAIDTHGLQAKAYGSPEDIAADPNVDIVLVTVDVAFRRQLMEPVLRRKKNMYIEFPAAPTAADVEELAALATKQGVKVVVGAQGRADPAIVKLRELVSSATIGDIVSTTMTGFIPIVTADGWPAAQREFLDIDSGISRAKGVLGHILDSFTSVVGDFKIVQSALKVQDKLSKLMDEKNNVMDPAYPTTSPDTFAVQGVLNNGALASLALRSVRTAVDDTGFRWIISGTKGELEFTLPPGIMSMGAGPRIRFRKWGDEGHEVLLVDEEPQHITAVTAPGTNVARVWEAFAKGDHASTLSMDGALKIHQLLETIIDNAVYAP